MPRRKVKKPQQEYTEEDYLEWRKTLLAYPENHVERLKYEAIIKERLEKR